jgi:hypothetical protein
LWRVVPQVLYQRLAYYNMKWYAGSPHILTHVLSKNQPVVHLCTVLGVEVECGLIVVNYEGQSIKQ